MRFPLSFLWKTRHALFACFFVIEVTSASAAVSSMSKAVGPAAAWIKSQSIALCFPELYTTSLFNFSGNAADGPQLPLNRLQLDLQFEGVGQYVPPSLREHEIYRGDYSSVYKAYLSHFYAAYDDRLHLAVVMRLGDEYAEQVVIANATDPPKPIFTGPLLLALNDGITLGSSQPDVENYFAPFLIRRSALASTKRCGMIAERFGTKDPDFMFVFVYKRGELVAYSTLFIA